jgi:hypothetical protein
MYFFLVDEVIDSVHFLFQQFTEQNPHWETDWLAEREKAYERSAEERHRLKEERNPLPPGVDQQSPLLASLNLKKQFTGYSKDTVLLKWHVARQYKKFSDIFFLNATGINKT